MSPHVMRACCAHLRNLSALSPCTQEEADTRLMLHAADCVNEGHTRLLTKTVDADEVAIAISMCQQMSQFWIVLELAKTIGTLNQYMRYVHSLALINPWHYLYFTLSQVVIKLHYLPAVDIKQHGTCGKCSGRQQRYF